MDNQFDVGLAEDFDNMTRELAAQEKILVYPRDESLEYDGQEGEGSGLGTPVPEIVFLQELGTTHEVVQSGQFNVGDARIHFQSNTTAEEEGYVIHNGFTYKIISFDKVRGQTNGIVLYVKAFAKKLPKR